MSQDPLLFPYSNQPDFLSFLEEKLVTCTKQNQTLTLITAKLANAPLIAEFYGYETANQLLDTLCHRINKHVKPECTIYKLAIDQLGIILVNASKDEIEKYCHSLYQFIQHSSILVHDHHNFAYFNVTLGTATAPLDCSNVKELTSHAYFACSYVPNMPGDSWLHYADLQDFKQKHQSVMERVTFLQNAFKEKRVKLAYQPIINSTTGKADYYECLLRIIDQHGNLTSAGLYIEAAEQLGLIADVDKEVLSLVANELTQSPHACLSFNVSGKTIDNQEWLNMARDLLSDPSVASRAIIEITETAVQCDLRRSISFVSSLQEIGCRVALDDFGTGYTSFRQLRSLPIDIVKIDGSFIRDIATSHDNMLFVKTLLRLIEGFGLTAVAEFVENGEIAKLLIDIGVPYFQGNYFAAALNHRPWIQEESI